MARVNLSNPPYYDDTDIGKQYYQLLAIPGRVAQAREFTAMQTTLREIIKSIGDSILRNGDIIEGCQVLVSGTSVTVTEGRVYMEGIVMPVLESRITINGTGVETIGVKLMEVVVQEDIDPVTGKDTLRDPAQGYDNYNQPGCYRLKRYLQVVANDSEAAIIATLIDGDIMVETYAPEYDTLTQTLARRTYDESGSYIVEGLNSRVEYLNDSQYNLVVESGKAYVLGYELKIPTARRIPMNRANLTGEVTVPYLTYQSGVDDYQLDESPYVESIVSVTGRVSTSVSATSTGNSGSYRFQETPIIPPAVVSQGGTNYSCSPTVGVSGDYDCYIQRDGNNYNLVWNSTENFPANGTTYTITYQYMRVFESGFDYELTYINGGHYLTWLGNNTPIPDTTFEVVYKQYLARKDLVYMDKYGVISVVEGVSAPEGSAYLPEAPLNTLTLAYINNPPNGTTDINDVSELITVDNVGLKRFTMNDIQKLLNRVQTIEYDQAVISLNDDARQIDTTSDKKGIWTDPLVDLSRIDFYYNKGSSGETLKPNLPVYDMALDLACNICYLPIITRTYDLNYNEASSSVHKYNRLVSLAVNGESIVLSQPNATKSFLINPYSMFPQMPEVSIDPAVDSWIEDTIIEVPMSLTNSAIVSMSTRTVDNTTASRNNNSNWARSTSSSTSETAIGARTETYTNDSVISESAITYMRQREITVEGSNFPTNLQNIACYFDGVRVPLTPIEGTVAGTSAGTVNADEKGYLKATFEIPQRVLTGTREVLLKSDTPIEGMITEGFNLYIAEGTARRIERTVTTVTTVLLERVTTSTIRNVYVDPVGQTFVLDKMTILKGINLYFESKPTVNTPVTCEIRGVSNGAITSTVYASKTLFPADVNISTDATVATRFEFTDPMLVEENKEYAFVVRSTADTYRIWVAELGGVDVNTGDLVLKNSYMTGVMMSSSNNSTWTSHQTTDIKFSLVEDTYVQSSIMTFDALSLEDAARIYLTADAAMPKGTTIDWTYSLDGTSYQSITPYNITLLGNTYSTVYLRAALSRSSDSTLSPLIALDTLSLTASHYDQVGNYLSRNISNLDTYTGVKVICDVHEEVGTAFEVKVSVDGGSTWIGTLKTDSTRLNYGWQEVTYTASVPSATQFRVWIKATSNTKYLTPAFRRLRCIMF